MNHQIRNDTVPESTCSVITMTITNRMDTRISESSEYSTNLPKPMRLLELPTEVLTTILEYACASDAGLVIDINYRNDLRPILRGLGQSGSFKCSLPLVCKQFRDIVLCNSLIYKCNMIIIYKASELLSLVKNISHHNLSAINTLRITHTALDEWAAEVANERQSVDTVFRNENNNLQKLELFVGADGIDAAADDLLKIGTTRFAEKMIRYFRFQDFEIVLDAAMIIKCTDFDECKTSEEEIDDLVFVAENLIMNTMLMEGYNWSQTIQAAPYALT